MRRPTRITPDPIIDAVVELRYESDIPPDAILGMLFAQVKSKYSDFKKLPITAIPEAIRNTDPALQFNPHYQSQSDPFNLNVGPRVLSLSNTGPYSGWKEKYFPELTELLQKVQSAGVVKKFSRLGVRYIDFFELDIYKHANLNIEFNDKPLKTAQTTFAAVFMNNEFLTRAQIANNTNVKGKMGSIIDTDTYFEPQGGFDFEGLTDLIDRCHEASVGFFFELLKEEFIKTLHPEYAS